MVAPETQLLTLITTQFHLTILFQTEMNREQTMPSLNLTVNENDALQNDTTVNNNALERKALMIDVYTEAVGHPKCENTLKCINTVLRCAILPKKKFVDDGEGFGRFNKPDFRNENQWVTILYKKIPSLDMMTDKMKCKVWITYRKKIKEQFSLHRSAVTLKIQKAFIAGKS